MKESFANAKTKMKGVIAGMMPKEFQNLDKINFGSMPKLALDLPGEMKNGGFTADVATNVAEGVKKGAAEAQFASSKGFGIIWNGNDKATGMAARSHDRLLNLQLAQQKQQTTALNKLTKNGFRWA
jgi:hypothetical protein